MAKEWLSSLRLEAWGLWLLLSYYFGSTGWRGTLSVIEAGRIREDDCGVVGKLAQAVEPDYGMKMVWYTQFEVILFDRRFSHIQYVLLPWTLDSFDYKTYHILKVYGLLSTDWLPIPKRGKVDKPGLFMPAWACHRYQTGKMVSRWLFASVG